MKRFLLFILALVVLAGCSKQEIEDIDIWNGYQNYKYSTMTTDLMAGQHINIGTVQYVMTDDAHFEATYTLTGGWTMYESHLYAGDYDAMPVNKPGAPKIGKFPFKEDHDPAVSVYTYSIPCADLPPGSTGFVCAAHCAVTGPGGQGETGWAAGNKTFSDKGWGTYTSDFYQQSLDIVVLYGIIDNTNSGTLTIIHIDANTHIGEIILAESVASNGTVDAAAYDPLTGDLFFVIGNTLYVVNMNDESPVEAVGTLSGIANGGAFIGTDYYYLDVDPNSPNYLEIIQVQLTYDNGWTLVENTDYSSAMPNSDINISDIASDGNYIYLIGTDYNGTPADYSDDMISLINYNISAGTWSGAIGAEIVASGNPPQVAVGADGNLYATEVSDSGETVIKILDPFTGFVIPSDNDDIGVGDGEGVIDIAPGPVR